jgi:apolipoprotein N-acyltransferase
MERLLQYLDDIDDLVGALGLLGERIRGLLLATVTLLACLIAAVSVVLFTLAHPPTALPIGALLVLTLVHRTVADTRQTGQGIG